MVALRNTKPTKFYEKFKDNAIKSLVAFSKNYTIFLIFRHPP